MQNKLNAFLIRWALNTVGLWVAVRFLGSGYDGVEIHLGLFGFLIAGLVFSIVYSVFKSLFVILAMPFILVSLGLFLLVLNGLLVYISLKIAPGISMSFFNSILTGILLSLVNYILSTTLLRKK